MSYSYLCMPFAAWLVAGALKFSINSLVERKLAFGSVGYGGFPSNHSAIVSSVAGLIGFREGVSHPAFGVALALAFVVVMDAVSLRKQVGLHARAINELSGGLRGLRERIGHTRVEALGGVIVGIGLAFVVSLLWID